MVAQKSLELIGIEIRKHVIARDKSWNIRLFRKLFHLFVRLPIFADIDLNELVAL